MKKKTVTTLIAGTLTLAATVALHESVEPSNTMPPKQAPHDADLQELREQLVMMTTHLEAMQLEIDTLQSQSSTLSPGPSSVECLPNEPAESIERDESTEPVESTEPAESTELAEPKELNDPYERTPLLNS